MYGTTKWRISVALCLILAASGCGDSHHDSVLPTAPTQVQTPVASPTTPAAAAPTMNSIRLGIAGNGEPSFDHGGQTKQVWALGVYTDGSESDVTNRALWQTSNPVVATVSPAGVVTSGGYGAALILATVGDVVGSLGVTVVPPPGGCRVTLSPPRLVFGAFENYGSVLVTADPSDCRWTVASDASWLPYRYDPGRSGSGTFNYRVPANSTAAARSANLVVLATGGVIAMHTVEQERPLSCSYVMIPPSAQFTKAGGTGQVRVDTTPDDCRWNARLDSFYGTITSGQSGTGDGVITYTIPQRGSGFGTVYTVYLTVSGLSGENPSGEHAITVPF